MKQESSTSPELPERSQLPLALGIAIGASLVTTVVSVVIYNVTGFYKLDLSRPGYESERQNIEDRTEETFDTTSPLTKEALDSILHDFDTRVENLKSYGDFRESVLTDESLQIQ